MSTRAENLRHELAALDARFAALPLDAPGRPELLAEIRQVEDALAEANGQTLTGEGTLRP